MTPRTDPTAWPLWLALIATLAGCGDDPPVCEIGERPARKVFHGGAVPAVTPVTTEQLAAIGELGGCSGALIAPTWVLTAAHCELTAGATFCTGASVAPPDACAEATRVVAHPHADLMLLELAAPLPSAAPFALADPLELGDVGGVVEAVGYGDTETGERGLRRFVAAPLVGLPGDFAVIDGEGKRGTCLGDSGGPLLVVDGDGLARIAGALSEGHASCVGRAAFTRVDVYRDWIEQHAGPTPGGSPGAGCGNVDGVGRCAADGAAAVWCEAGAFRHAPCEGDARCGWDEAEAGFRCVRGPDTCLGFDGIGGCDGEVAVWCEAGALQRRDCAACGAVCSRFGAAVGAACIDDPCGGLDLAGRCDGDVAEWCDGDQLLTRDCAAMGLRCGLVNDAVGYFCL